MSLQVYKSHLQVELPLLFKNIYLFMYMRTLFPAFWLSLPQDGDVRFCSFSHLKQIFLHYRRLGQNSVVGSDSMCGKNKRVHYCPLPSHIVYVKQNYVPVVEKAFGCQCV